MKWSQTTPSSSIWTTDQFAYALNIDSDIAAGAAEQSLLTSEQAAAVEYAETVMGCSLLTRTITAVYYGPTVPFAYGFQFGSTYSAYRNRLPLPRGPVISITSVTDANGTISSSNYQLQGEGTADLLYMKVGWTDPLTVVYQAGYGSSAANVPPDIAQAILTHVATIHERRESATDRTITAVPHSLEAFYISKARTLQVR